MPPGVRRAARALLALTAVSISTSTTGMQAGVVGLLVLAVASVPMRWHVIRRTPLDTTLGLFLGVLALSTVASGHPFEAAGWGDLWIIVTYFVVFWWLFDHVEIRWFVRVLVAAAAVVAVYGILQHFTGADWYRAALGRPLVVRPRDASAHGYAVVGFFRNYLTFSHVMLFPLCWASALALDGAWLGLLASPLLALAVLLSTARGAALAAVGAFAALALSARDRLPRAVVASVAVATCLAFALAPDLAARAAHMLDTGGGNAGRMAIYRANLDIVGDHPLLGLGFGRYRNAALPYYAAHPDADRRSHAHSDYLHIAAESGLVGLAAFALLYAVVLRRGWRALVTPHRDLWATGVGAWVGIIAFLLGGLTQYNFGDSEVALTMWVAAAVLMRCAEQSR